MLAKNQTLEMTCTGLGAALEGVCRAEGQVVFVPGALPGETVRARVIKARKAFAVGKLEAVLNPSAARRTPLCPYYARCGGCQGQHMAYQATLAAKEAQVRDCLARIGGVQGADVGPAWGMDDPWRYRNKGAFPAGGEAGRPRIGLYAARSHEIVDAPEGCLLQTEGSDALVAAVRAWMTTGGVAPYDEETGRGLVRHVMTREAADGRMMLVLAVNGDGVPRAGDLVDRARAAVPGLSGIVLSEHRRATNVILGSTFHTLWGEGALQDTLAGYRIRVSPQTFLQVNRPQAERLYREALRLAALTGDETVWDLYCGCGTITLPLAARCRQAIGVEVVPEAVRDAEYNAEQNGVTNARFIAGAVEDVLGALLAEGRPDVAVIDPPRKGMDPAALAALVQAAPRRIVYVSCDPATLARDVGFLAANGYTVGSAQPVDMFGWTGHVETVVLLTRMAGRKDC